MSTKQKMYHHLKKLGVGLKVPVNAHEMYSTLMNMKPNQLMVGKHIIMQSLGAKPTHFHPKYDHSLEKHHIQAFRKTKAADHFESGHKLAEFYRHHHVKGGGIGSAVTSGLKAVANSVKKIGKTAIKYAAKGAEWVAKNPDKVKQIFEGVSTGIDVVKSLTRKEEDKINFDADPFTTDDEKAPDKTKAGGGGGGVSVNKPNKTKYTL